MGYRDSRWHGYISFGVRWVLCFLFVRGVYEINKKKKEVCARQKLLSRDQSVQRH